MKKLMIAFAVAAFAVVANAATFKWSTGMGGNVYLPGTTTTLASATAYLIDAEVMSQATAVANFANGSLSITSIASQTVNAGKISSTTLDWGTEGDMLSTYFLILADVDGSQAMYLSTYKTNMEAPAEGKSTLLTFSEKATSQAAGFSAAEGFNGAGWYTASVPEPTSALMLLVGLAGLALKRKVA